MTVSHRPNHRARSHRLAALPLAAAIFALAVLPASAHVRVTPDSTTSGSYAGLTFRVPNESSTASTTKIVLTLPQDRPLSSVSTKPVPGWRAAVAVATLPTPVTEQGTTLTRAPRTVTWTADPGAAIGPGQFQEFSLSAGPLPSPGPLVLPVAQTYSDGTVVDWDQVAPAGRPEPEHPAPELVVTAAAPTRGAVATPAGAATSADPLARTLGGAALVVALAGAAVAVRRPRRDPVGRS